MKKIEFFNLVYENFNNINIFIINIDKHVFYYNVYIFINYFKNLIKEFIDE